jgi:hypothetical protein
MQYVIRGLGAVVAGLAFIIVSHTAVDKLLEAAGIFPPPEEGLHITWMLLLATAYRTVLSVAGCYLTAYLAPGRPLLHAIILGSIGLLGASAAAVVVIPMELSPDWYPIALAALALPSAWIGGKIRESQLGDRK